VGLLVRGRVVAEVALGLAHRAGARGDDELGVGARAPDHELGAAAADVEDEGLLVALARFATARGS
jgi:hypothetical protein